MSILIDTNVLLRRTQAKHEHHLLAAKTVAGILASGETAYFTPQNIAEFWNAATRPVANNGLGLSPAQTSSQVAAIEALLTLLPDSPLAYEEWKRLVLANGVTGVRVHDARLVAAMNVHGVRRILTFDRDDFTGFGIEVIRPSLVP